MTAGLTAGSLLPYFLLLTLAKEREEESRVSVRGQSLLPFPPSSPSARATKDEGEEKEETINA